MKLDPLQAIMDISLIHFLEGLKTLSSIERLEAARLELFYTHKRDAEKRNPHASRVLSSFPRYSYIRVFSTKAARRRKASPERARSCFTVASEVLEPFGGD
jgi:hypothetical protein